MGVTKSGKLAETKQVVTPQNTFPRGMHFNMLSMKTITNSIQKLLTKQKSVVNTVDNKLNAILLTSAFLYGRINDEVHDIIYMIITKKHMYSLLYVYCVITWENVMGNRYLKIL